MKTTTFFLGLLLPIFYFSCKSTVPTTPSVSSSRPAPSILTVILKVDPALDTLTVADIIRGPGSLRQDYPRQVGTPSQGELLFTFLGPQERVLRQTILPYPGANRYEVPSEDGTIEAITVPEADRVLMLRTQYATSLRFLRVEGQSEGGRSIDQIISLSLRE